MIIVVILYYYCSTHILVNLEKLFMVHIDFFDCWVVVSPIIV